MKLIFSFLSALSLIVLASIFISPQTWWISGLLSLMIPVVLIVNTALFLYLAIIGSRYFIYPMVICAIGLLFLNRTVAIHSTTKSDEILKVLSYNVRVFNVYSHLNSNFTSSRETIDWVVDRDDDIKCLQEFYVHPESDIFSTVKAIRQKNPYYYFEPTVTNSHGAQFGIAIFSKYPIIHRGSLEVSESSYNNILFADIVKDQDTLRVYNVHLESMSIDEQELTSSNSETISKNLRQLVSQLKHGFIRRALQIDNLCEHLQRSPYPVILAGDLNDMPYSYSYQRLKKYLYSSFENGGQGFGFSFNGKLFFLRIDNQFYSEGIKLSSFETHRTVPYTDHFPISADYALE